MEKLTNKLNKLSLGEQIGYLKQPHGFATKAIHVAQEPERWKSRAVVPPIVTSTVFEVSLPVAECENFYSRLGNPTRQVIEENLAALDNAKYALAFSAGVSAITAVITTLSEGDGIIASRNYYTGTIDAFEIVNRLGIKVDYVDFDDLKNVENALKPNIKIVWAETNMNPLMNVIDIKALTELVHSKSSAYVVVDNTYLTPYFHRPLELGADIALYSMTKYFSGHSDIIGGSIACNDEKLYKALKSSQTATGTMMSPFDCYLINRSVKTLALRMEKHFENSVAVAKWLENHPKIGKVLHPSLPSHDGFKVSLKQCYGHSGVFAFYLKEDSYEVTKKFLENLKLIPFATSLGGVETTISFPREMSHRLWKLEDCLKFGITYALLRLSVGIEDVDDIIGDLKNALDVI